MANINLVLQRGFNGGPLIVKANDVNVYKKRDLRTKLLLGYADAFEIQVNEGIVRVDVELPARKISATIELQLRNTIYLGVSLIDEKIVHQISDKPFTFV